MSSTVNVDSTAPHEDLDPDDWGRFRELVHESADHLVDHLMSVRDAPVWRSVPESVRAELTFKLPTEGIGTAAAFAKLTQLILPYSTGNLHPRFMGWVHGGGTAGGLIAAMAEAAINANVGGRDHGAVYVERQVIDWMRQLFGFSERASGILTSGTSMATLIALTIARQAKANWDVRLEGMSSGSTGFRLYAAEGVHECTTKALELLGFGRKSLVPIGTASDGSMDVRQLSLAIAADRSNGLRPFCVVATVGSVDIGAVDNLESIGAIARENDLWFHVDGAFGALAILVPELAPLVKGIANANSLAFDFHKWGQVTYDCGCVLVRDQALHRAAFAVNASYLDKAARGLAGGAPWFCDFGPELSRGFRALKTWFLFVEHGAGAIGRAIRRSCDIAAYLATLVRAEPMLELLAPVPLNIVCFRVCPLPGEDADHLNQELVADLQDRGLAAPSTTRIAGQLAIRCCFINHRTTRSDAEFLVQTIKELATERRRASGF